MKHRMKTIGAGISALAILGGVAAVAPVAQAGSDAAGECESVDDVTLQLQWFYQGQFAGYMAAVENGLYDKYCLNVEIIQGGTDIPPQQAVADGIYDFAISWVSKSLQTREQGANIVNIAQIFQRSGTLQVSFKDAGITSPEDFAGRTVGNWGFGNEFEIFAALGQAGLDPATDVTLVQQQFDMGGLLDGSIDAAEAMTYNEYAQVLEAVNPDTGELYTADDLNVVNYEEVGVGMLQDSIWADGERLANDEAYADIAVRFLAGSIEGWAWVRDNPEAAADIVLKWDPILGASHQLWQVNEVNKLIWPAENGVGYIDQAAWDRTVELSLNAPNLEGATVITEQPSEGAFTNEYVEAAWALLGDSVDIHGADFAPIEVTLQEGGA